MWSYRNTEDHFPNPPQVGAPGGPQPAVRKPAWPTSCAGRRQSGHRVPVRIVRVRPQAQSGEGEIAWVHLRPDLEVLAVVGFPDIAEECHHAQQCAAFDRYLRCRMIAFCFRGEIVVCEHRALRDCALARDAAGASTVLREHINGCVAFTLARGAIR